jgi:hypothetical protein
MMVQSSWDHSRSIQNQIMFENGVLLVLESPFWQEIARNTQTLVKYPFNWTECGPLRSSWNFERMLIYIRSINSKTFNTYIPFWIYLSRVIRNHSSQLWDAGSYRVQHSIIWVLKFWEDINIYLINITYKF